MGRFLLNRGKFVSYFHLIIFITPDLDFGAYVFGNGDQHNYQF